MKVQAYIHSLKDNDNHCHILGEAEILDKIGCNEYLAEYNGIRCTAIYNPYVGRYFVDDVYGIQDNTLYPNPMKKFRVTITERLETAIEVEAENEYQAEQIIYDGWKSSKYILDSDDFVGVDVKAVSIDL